MTKDEALRLAREALMEVEQAPDPCELSGDCCPWCRWKTGHSNECSRQLALAAIDEAKAEYPRAE